MTTKVGDIRGYGINYDSRSKKFTLTDSNGDQVGEGKTQDEVEAQAEKLAKTQFPFPIEAFMVSHLELLLGRITSLDTNDRRVWFSFADKTGYRTREKADPDYRKIYAVTPANKRILAAIAERHASIASIEEAIAGLIKDLEKRIDLKYFGLPSRY